jgi:hypothetical protein
MSLAIDTTALHIAGLFYASALAASVTMPLALVAARPSYTSDQFLLRDNSSNAQRAKKFRFIRWSVCKTAPFLAAQPYRSPCVRLRTYFAPLVRHPGWRPWATVRIFIPQPRFCGVIVVWRRLRQKSAPSPQDWPTRLPQPQTLAGY